VVPDDGLSRFPWLPHPCRYAKARLTCIPPKANGLVNKVITSWTKEVGREGVLTLKVEEPTQ
jgi:hypothetical protein